MRMTDRPAGMCRHKVKICLISVEETLLQMRQQEAEIILWLGLEEAERRGVGNQEVYRFFKDGLSHPCSFLTSRGCSQIFWKVFSMLSFLELKWLPFLPLFLCTWRSGEIQRFWRQTDLWISLSLATFQIHNIRQVILALDFPFRKLELAQPPHRETVGTVGGNVRKPSHSAGVWHMEPL